MTKIQAQYRGGKAREIVKTKQATLSTDSVKDKVNGVQPGNSEERVVPTTADNTGNYSEQITLETKSIDGQLKCQKSSHGSVVISRKGIA